MNILRLHVFELSFDSLCCCVVVQVQKQVKQEVCELKEKSMNFEKQLQQYRQLDSNKVGCCCLCNHRSNIHTALVFVNCQTAYEKEMTDSLSPAVGLRTFDPALIGPLTHLTCDPFDL